MAFQTGLSELLDSLDPGASAVQRHLWIIRLLAWVRGDCSTVVNACRHAASSVFTHLDAHGISVNLVFQLRQLRQLRARVQRIHALLDCLFAPDRQVQTARLVAHLVTAGLERRSLRALITDNSSMLASKVAERSAETGEYYITRTLPE